ncbi:MAG TPA: class F sortase [Jiangellaceae bacterium]|nr:class F sortase [Jiangellaceae bacterium]
MPERHRLTTRTACSYLLALVMLGGCATAGASDMPAPPAGTASATPSLTPHSDLSTYRSIRGHSETALPVRLRIPAIDVDTGLESLGLASDQSIEVPSEPGVAGWWEGGPRPGQVGPAVIMGHVRWNAPAVFSRLDRLERGDEVLVDRADGTTARFVVTGQGMYRKAAFPSDLVYYPTLDPELRLVTCGGPYDRAAGTYTENLVVFAARAS